MMKSEALLPAFLSLLVESVADRLPACWGLVGVLIGVDSSDPGEPIFLILLSIGLVTSSFSLLPLLNPSFSFRPRPFLYQGLLSTTNRSLSCIGLIGVGDITRLSLDPLEAE